MVTAPALVQRIRVSSQALKLADANEAQTRFALIDMILFELLGWTRDDISVEDRVSEDGKTTFSDYKVATGAHHIIIEAKRASFDFSGIPKARKALLKGNWLTKPVGDPVKQARDYARTEGAGFCVATNGISWVIFPVNRRDGVSVEESSAILFDDLTNILDDEPNELVALLSRHAVISGSLSKALLGTERDQNDERRLNSIYDRSFSRMNRSSVFQHVEREIITAFNEELLADNLELLRSCYVTTPERMRFDARIRMYILKQDDALKAPAVNLFSNPAGVKALVESSNVSSRPIALLTLGLV